MLEVSREPRSQDASWVVEDTGRKARHRPPGLMGRAGEPVTVAPGALADLVVVDGDPSASLRVLADALTVGTCLRRATPAKDQLAQHQAVRQKRVHCPLMSALEQSLF